MNPYGALAAHYDELMSHIDYDAIVRYLTDRFRRAGLKAGASVLDLACGTGSVSIRLAALGYDLVSIDASSDMLTEAAKKNSAGETFSRNPLWLCQTMQRLDLHDVVDAAVCCFDGVNYLASPRDLLRAFRRVRLFLRPGGAFLFDVLPPKEMIGRDGRVYVSESWNAYCIWTSHFTRGRLRTEMDLFIRDESGLSWRRCAESHVQRAYDRDALLDALEAAGFCDVRVRSAFSAKPAKDTDGRWSVEARADRTAEHKG